MDKQVYLLTGLEGCGACINSTVKFIEQNSSNPKICFIVSGRSKKELRNRFSNHILNRKNFIFDQDLMALKLKLVDPIHPKVYLVDNKRIVYQYEIDYTNADSLFRRTKHFLKLTFNK